MSRLDVLGKNIKRYRKAKGYRQLDLAVALDVSEEYISRVENGLKFIGLRRLFKLADILEVKISDLMNFD